jgi:hypothetical protein
MTDDKIAEIEKAAVAFDCIGDPDELQHEDVESVIEEMVDASSERDSAILDVIRGICPVTVDAYSPAVDAAGWVKRTTEVLVDRVGDEWSEYGDPNVGGYAGGIDAGSSLENRIKEALEDFIEEAHVWSCHKVGERVYSYDEVVAMMREYSPEWFDDDGRTRQEPPTTEAK